MYQDSLDQVRKNYYYYRNLKDKIFEAQDSLIELKFNELVSKYEDLKEELSYYTDDVYYESLLKDKKELENISIVQDYINGNKVDAPEVEEYRMLLSTLCIDRKAKIEEIEQAIKNMEELDIIKKYLNANFIVNKYDDTYTTVELMQQKAFQNIDDPDFTYVVVDEKGFYQFFNLENGKSVIISKNNPKALHDFYSSHYVISNPEIDFFGLKNISYFYQKEFLKDNFKSAEECTKAAREFVINYPSSIIRHSK